MEPPDHVLMYLLGVPDLQEKYVSTPEQLQQAEHTRHATPRLSEGWLGLTLESIAPGLTVFQDLNRVYLAGFPPRELQHKQKSSRLRSSKRPRRQQDCAMWESRGLASFDDSRGPICIN